MNSRQPLLPALALGALLSTFPPGGTARASSGDPADLQPNGTVCAEGTVCTSGFCADGVCCNAPCTDSCVACNGQGTTGTCTPLGGVPANGHPACTNDGSMCAGACDGRSAQCTYPGATITCRQASCANGMATDGANCDGAGHCPAPQMTSCDPYDCAVFACSKSCAGNGDCVTGYYCDALSRCNPVLKVGDACTMNGSCATGHCVDGHCCESDCSGQCASCGVKGQEGKCVAVTGPPAGGRIPCKGSGACGGACDGSIVAACAFPGASTECAAAVCTSGVATAARSCDGAGMCAAGMTMNCGKAGCMGTTCAAPGSTGCSCEVASRQGERGAFALILLFVVLGAGFARRIRREAAASRT